MSIRVRPDACTGCGRCAEVCPGSLIELRGRVARMAYPRDCWGCASCVKACRFGAIDFFLGADVGGRGSTLGVSYEGSVLHWRVLRFDGADVRIEVDARSANAY